MAVDVMLIIVVIIVAAMTEEEIVAALLVKRIRKPVIMPTQPLASPLSLAVF